LILFYFFWVDSTFNTTPLPQAIPRAVQRRSWPR
jgi:hypothetical protein